MSRRLFYREKKDGSDSVESGRLYGTEVREINRQNGNNLATFGQGMSVCDFCGRFAENGDSMEWTKGLYSGFAYFLLTCLTSALNYSNLNNLSKKESYGYSQHKASVIKILRIKPSFG